MMLGVPGYLGVKRRQKRPVALDVTFCTEPSGSMVDYLRFIEDVQVVAELERSVRGEGVGVTELQNRYSRTTMQSELNLGSIGRWLSGEQVVNLSAAWQSGTTTGTAFGGGVEDQTGSASVIATRNRAYQAGAERILISASNEQDPFSQLTRVAQVEGELTAPLTRQRFVAMSGVQIAYTGPLTPPAGTLMGVVFVSPTQRTAIYRSGDTYALLGNAAAGDFTFTARYYANGSPYPPAGVTSPFTLAGAVARTETQNNEQIVNTPRLAAATGGALYDLEQMRGDPVGLQVFADSLGEVLGRLLYEAA